jgi:large subunit ribosomal protein L3
MATREGLLGRKVGMTQIFSDSGQVVPVTIVEAGPCFVTQVKTDTGDEYSAIQIGFGEAKRINKPEEGHLKDIPALRYLREIRTDDAAEYERGQKLDVSIFDVGDLVDVVGTSKGKGFAGTVKRHNFRGGPITHGQSDRVRAPGSIGSGTTPGRVFKGMKMSGHMGARRVTVQNLEVVLVDPDRNLLAVRGAVPGAKQGLVMIHKARKN